MIVTDKKYAVEKRLLIYLDRICERLTTDRPKLDYPLLVDGYEGYGKSNIAAGIAYYVAWKTGRKFTVDNVFFDPEEMLNFALTTDKQIIMWDEAALGGLAMSHGNKIQMMIIQMLMVARKKRHFFIINIPRFIRLKEPIIERCMGLIHVYARNEKEFGRFTFYKKDGLESLYEDWKRTRRKPKYYKYQAARGTFSEALPLVINEADYEKKKDEGIKSLLVTFGDKKYDKNKIELYNIKRKMSKLKFPIQTQEEFAQKLGIPRSTITTWSLLAENEPNIASTSRLPSAEAEHSSIREDNPGLVVVPNEREEGFDDDSDEEYL